MKTRRWLLAAAAALTAACTTPVTAPTPRARAAAG
jgi:hypothetical protein